MVANFVRCLLLVANFVRRSYASYSGTGRELMLAPRGGPSPPQTPLNLLNRIIVSTHQPTNPTPGEHKISEERHILIRGFCSPRHRSQQLAFGSTDAAARLRLDRRSGSPSARHRSQQLAFGSTDAAARLRLDQAPKNTPYKSRTQDPRGCLEATPTPRRTLGRTGGPTPENGRENGRPRPRHQPTRLTTTPPNQSPPAPLGGVSVAAGESAGCQRGVRGSRPDL